MIYWELFLSFLQVGLFSFGGGYAAMPLIRGQVVTVHHWLSMSEFTDLITISQMTPGPIAVNSATFVGTKIAGTLGALVATFGCILPSCIIVTVIARLYLKNRKDIHFRLLLPHIELHIFPAVHKIQPYIPLLIPHNFQIVLYMDDILLANLYTII